MKRVKKKRILNGSLSDLVEKFSQQNIVEEIEKRYQNSPARLIPIAQIDDTHFVSGVAIPEETIEYFATRLKEKGFYSPLVVRPKENGRYEIIMGRKRFYGAMRAGHASLPCAIAEVEDEEMLDIIFGSRCFDLGAIYNWGGIYTQIAKISTDDIRSRFEQVEDGIEIALETDIDVILSLFY